MRKLILLSLVCILAIVGCQSLKPSNSTIPDFEPSMEAHLNGVVMRSIQDYQGVLPSNNDITMIFPNGAYFDNTTDIIDTHVGWFSDSTWTFNYELLKKEQLGTAAFALLDVELIEPSDTKIDTTAFYLSLVFKYDQAQWTLLHDQCTIHD